MILHRVIKVLFNVLQMVVWFTALCEQLANPGQGIIHKCDCSLQELLSSLLLWRLSTVLVKPWKSRISAKFKQSPYETQQEYIHHSQCLGFSLLPASLTPYMKVVDHIGQVGAEAFMRGR